mmetsp:Transcript_71820/g.219887  ORF Transcript_71820/g.219887 Transcript_71820/m.219887 type:complete len:201 (-) Transcript_71820:363-965(-)
MRPSAALPRHSTRAPLGRSAKASSAIFSTRVTAGVVGQSPRCMWSIRVCASRRTENSPGRKPSFLAVSPRAAPCRRTTRGASSMVVQGDSMSGCTSTSTTRGASRSPVARPTSRRGKARSISRLALRRRRAPRSASSRSAPGWTRTGSGPRASAAAGFITAPATRPSAADPRNRPEGRRPCRPTCSRTGRCRTTCTPGPP